MAKNFYKKKDLVSIIINCHNGEKYIKECIDSAVSKLLKIGKLLFGTIFQLIKPLQL